RYRSVFFSSRRRHTRCYRDWSSDVCSSDLVWDDRGSVIAIAGSTAIAALASIAFIWTSAFDAVYLIVAIGSSAVLLGLTVKFLAHPSPETAWAGYRFSGIYLAAILIGMMADAILRIPL